MELSQTVIFDKCFTMNISHLGLNRLSALLCSEVENQYIDIITSAAQPGAPVVATREAAQLNCYGLGEFRFCNAGVVAITTYRNIM